MTISSSSTASVETIAVGWMRVLCVMQTPRSSLNRQVPEGGDVCSIARVYTRKGQRNPGQSGGGVTALRRFTPFSREPLASVSWRRPALARGSRLNLSLPARCKTEVETDLTKFLREIRNIFL